MNQAQCPICRAASGGGYSVGDDTVFLCPQCGDYRLAETAKALLEKGTLQRPNPVWFRDLVRHKRGNSTEYPLITSGDLGA
jgi:hypothetical protein